MKRLAILLALIATPALAQQQPTPSQLAIQVQQIIGGWAQTIEGMQKENADLQSKLAAVTKERDELKAASPAK